MSEDSTLRRMAHPPWTHWEHSMVLSKVELASSLGMALAMLVAVRGAPIAASIVRRVDVTQRVLLLLVLKRKQFYQLKCRDDKTGTRTYSRRQITSRPTV